MTSVPLYNMSVSDRRIVPLGPTPVLLLVIELPSTSIWAPGSASTPVSLLPAMTDRLMVTLLPVVAATPNRLLIEDEFSIWVLLVLVAPRPIPVPVLLLITELRMNRLVFPAVRWSAMPCWPKLVITES